MKNIKFEKTQIILWAIMLLGIYARVVFYSYNRPFWNDECALALNFVNFDFLNCFKQLAYAQVAPPLFLVISGAISLICSNFHVGMEFSLRAFPLICSILSIVVFYKLSKQALNKNVSIFLALVLFCVNYRLLYYSQEFKQYSTDVLIFLGLLLSYFGLNINESSVKKLVMTGVAYAVSIWLSFVSIFALVAVFGTLLLKNIKDFKKILLLFLPAILSFVGLYFFSKGIQSNAYLHTYWQEGFLKADFSNVVPLMLKYFAYSFNSIFILIFFYIGVAVALFKIKEGRSLLLLFPILTAIALSYFSIYPLESRVSLYLVPVVILFVCKILDCVNLKQEGWNYVLSAAIIFLIAFPVIIETTYNMVLKNYDKEDIVTPLNIAAKKIKKGDVLYIPSGTEISYAFYKKNYHFKKVIIEKNRISDNQKYLHYLDSLKGHTTYYYVFSHFPNKQQRLASVYYWAKKAKSEKQGAFMQQAIFNVFLYVSRFDL
jgi:multidrug transporter EmrE-like cation transporter